MRNFRKLLFKVCAGVALTGYYKCLQSGGLCRRVAQECHDRPRSLLDPPAEEQELLLG